MTSPPTDLNSWDIPTGAFARAGAAPPQGRPAAPLELRAGARLADYQIAEALGRGGMGTVYRARHLPSGRDVALKVIPAASVGRRFERFRREAQATAALDHPNIIRIHSAGVRDGVAYQVIELVEGGRTLADALYLLPREALLRTVRDAARGLGHAHARGVVHRDVKPANILLEPDGRPRVADFGLALDEADDRLTRTGELVGTPVAMAPEQLHGDRDAIGPPTDVWALGLILYQGLTGEPPFPTTSLMQLSQAITSGDVKPPRALDPSISPALEQVCLRCLASQPAQRYADGEALAAALERALSDDRPARRGAPLVWAAAATALVLGLALIAALATRPAPAPPTPRAPLPRPPTAEETARVRTQLARALRDVAFVERGAAQPPLATRRARATAALQAVREATSDPALRGEAWLALARLEDPPQDPSPALAEAARLLPQQHPGLCRLQATRALPQDPAQALAWLAAAWPPGQRVPRDVAWIRGQALWALGRSAEALPELDRGAGHRLDPERCDLLAQAFQAQGDPEAAFDLFAHVQFLRGAHRADTERKYRKIRLRDMNSELTWQEALDGYTQVVTSDPLHHEARFMRAKTRFVWASDFEGLREAAWLLRDHSEYLCDVWSSLRNMARLVDLVDGGGLDRTLREQLTLRDDPDDHVLRGLLATAGVADRDAALRGLDAVLAEEPADVAAMTLRGLLRLRGDALDEAEDDLAAAWEANPRCGFASFGLALVEARRRRGPTAVWVHLEPLADLDQRPWTEDGWTAAFFPELGPYLHEPNFKPLAKGQ